MEIVILHGEYQSASYQRLQKYIEIAKNRNWEVARFDLDNVESFCEEISTENFFAKERLFIVDYKSMNSKTVSWINKNLDSFSGRVLVYAPFKITDRDISKFKQVKKVEDFNLPKNVFNFLNSFYPGNTKECLKNYNFVKANESLELIFFLLGKHLRDLFWVKVSSANIPYPSWRVLKLENQAEKFSQSQLKNIINNIADLDYMVKTSKTKLEDSLDLFIIKTLE